MFKTTTENMASIISMFWLYYRNYEEHEEFIAYHDLGLPLSYALDEEMFELTPMVEELIEETFGDLLEHLGAPDLEYTNLSELIDQDSEDEATENDSSEESTTASDADELAKWHKLLEDGVITEDEFAQKKKLILGL